MAKTIKESMKDLTQQEKGYIKDIASLTQTHTIIAKRKLTHVVNFINYRLNQIGALSDKLNKYLENNGLIEKFNLFKSVSQDYAAGNDDFGKTLSSIYLVLSDEIQKATVYNKEFKELLKISAALSNYIVSVFPDFNKKLKEIQNAE